VAYANRTNQPVYDLPETISATQEDVDLLIAFADESSPQQTNLLLLEAKLDTGWNNAQFRRKAGRLLAIFGENGRRWPGVEPHFAILSPDKPRKLDTTWIPAWMLRNNLPVWIELPKPQPLHKVTSCNDRGIPAQKGMFWMVEDR
jgi:hypothetical protein